MTRATAAVAASDGWRTIPRLKCFVVGVFDLPILPRFLSHIAETVISLMQEFSPPRLMKEQFRWDRHINIRRHRSSR